MAKKYMETYSSSNAAAQYPEERVNQPGYTAYHKEKWMNVKNICSIKATLS